MHLIEVRGATIFTSIVTIFSQRVFFICHLLFLFPFSLSLMMCLYNWVNYFLIIHLLILDFFLYQPFQKNSWGGARSCSRLVNSLFNQGCMRTGASTSPTPSLQGSAVQNPHHTVSLLHLPCSLLLSPRPLQLLSWTHSPGFTFSLLVFGE